jgi:hypothetical protein
MNDARSTKLNVREDRPTAISSSAHGSNLDSIGFNVAFLASRDPKLAIEIIKLYARAHKIQESDPQAPDEDFALFADEVTRILDDTTDDRS